MLSIACRSRAPPGGLSGFDQVWLFPSLVVQGAPESTSHKAVNPVRTLAAYRRAAGQRPVSWGMAIMGIPLPYVTHADMICEMVLPRSMNDPASADFTAGGIWIVAAPCRMSAPLSRMPPLPVSESCGAAETA